MPIHIPMEMSISCQAAATLYIERMTWPKQNRMSLVTSRQMERSDQLNSWIIANLMQTVLRHWPLLLMDNTLLWHPINPITSFLVSLYFFAHCYWTYNFAPWALIAMIAINLGPVVWTLRDWRFMFRDSLHLSGSMGTKWLPLKLWPTLIADCSKVALEMHVLDPMSMRLIGMEPSNLDFYQHFLSQISWGYTSFTTLDDWQFCLPPKMYTVNNEIHYPPQLASWMSSRVPYLLPIGVGFVECNTAQAIYPIPRSIMYIYIFMGAKGCQQ